MHICSVIMDCLVEGLSGGSEKKMIHSGSLKLKCFFLAHLILCCFVEDLEIMFCE